MAYLGTKPANSPLTSELIPDGLISTSDIADGAITTAKIENGAVVQADLATGVAGTGPAFSAYGSTTQSISAATFTKAIFDVEFFDTNNNYTSSRFTPTVAGYYQFSTAMYFGGAGNPSILQIYKNGNSYQELVRTVVSGGTTIGGSNLVYLNGSTDYVEVYVYSASATTIGLNSTFMWFSGSLVRAA